MVITLSLVTSRAPAARQLSAWPVHDSLMAAYVLSLTR